MKLEDLAIIEIPNHIDANEYSIATRAARTQEYENPLVREFIYRIRANQEIGCSLLDSTESILLAHLYNELRLNPDYHPSVAVLELLGSLNAKMALRFRERE